MFTSAFFLVDPCLPQTTFPQSHHCKPLPCRRQLHALQHFKSRLPDLKEKKSLDFFVVVFYNIFFISVSLYHILYFFNKDMLFHSFILYPKEISLFISD